MKMKNYFKIKLAILGFVLSTVIGCVDLTENPDFINPNTFYKSATELELGVNAISELHV